MTLERIKALEETSSHAIHSQSISRSASPLVINFLSISPLLTPQTTWLALATLPQFSTSRVRCPLPGATSCCANTGRSFLHGRRRGKEAARRRCAQLLPAQWLLPDHRAPGAAGAAAGHHGLEQEVLRPAARAEARSEQRCASPPCTRLLR
jgi:hypothetical protein